MNTELQHGHLQIVTTADGSNTIFNAQVGENYHSRHGALQESKHVFIDTGLLYYLQQRAGTEASVSVLEVGFGTGLNFLLSADACTQQKAALSYTGIEAYPLGVEMISQTGYNQYVPSALWESFLNIYTSSLNSSVQLNPYISLEVAACKLMDYDTDRQFDVIYFDAFAAIHQPEMWDDEAIAHTLKFLKPGGVFVTYAITGNLKRSIKALGLQVQKVPGAPGKREMLRALR